MGHRRHRVSPSRVSGSWALLREAEVSILSLAATRVTNWDGQVLPVFDLGSCSGERLTVRYASLQVGNAAARVVKDGHTAVG